MRFGVCAVLFLLVVGCNHEKMTTATPPPPANSRGTGEPKAARRDLTKNEKMSHSLALSSDIVQLCGLKATGSAAAPTFDYDKDQLTDDYDNVLQQLATCILRDRCRARTSSHRTANPRGTEEHNMRLRLSPREQRDQYLEALGIRKTSLSRTTRRALDATGTDAAGWAKDRRVDIMLNRARSTLPHERSRHVEPQFTFVPPPRPSGGACGHARYSVVERTFRIDRKHRQTRLRQVRRPRLHARQRSGGLGGRRAGVERWQIVVRITERRSSIIFPAGTSYRGAAPARRHR